MTTLQSALGGAAGPDFLRAVDKRQFVFPADHGQHQGFRNEWWYFTGNLQTDDGRHFGYQLTLFSIAINPSAEQPARASAWESGYIWMGHLALTDTGSGQHHEFERFSRENPGLAGARLEPFKLWLEDWQVLGSNSPDSFPWTLEAGQGEISISLTLQNDKAPVLQGDKGLSRKSAEPGNASYYYSLTRMPSAGTLQIGSEHFAVTGASWLDREWSTSVLADDQSGWDWFALQFDDGTELMYYQLLDAQGGAHSFSAGNLTNSVGQQQRIAMQDMQLQALQQWRSPNGTVYDTAWRMSWQGKVWVIQAVLDEQWMDVSLPYWEGAVVILDESDGRQLGRGYLEMVH